MPMNYGPRALGPQPGVEPYYQETTDEIQMRLQQLLQEEQSRQSEMGNVERARDAYDPRQQIEAMAKADRPGVAEAIASPVMAPLNLLHQLIGKPLRRLAGNPEQRMEDFWQTAPEQKFQMLTGHMLSNGPTIPDTADAPVEKTPGFFEVVDSLISDHDARKARAYDEAVRLFKLSERDQIGRMDAAYGRQKAAGEIQSRQTKDYLDTGMTQANIAQSNESGLASRASAASSYASAANSRASAEKTGYELGELRQDEDVRRFDHAAKAAKAATEARDAARKSKQDNQKARFFRALAHAKTEDERNRVLSQMPPVSFTGDERESIIGFFLDEANRRSAEDRLLPTLKHAGEADMTPYQGARLKMDALTESRLWDPNNPDAALEILRGAGINADRPNVNTITRDPIRIPPTDFTGGPAAAPEYETRTLPDGTVQHRRIR